MVHMQLAKAAFKIGPAHAQRAGSGRISVRC